MKEIIFRIKNLFKTKIYQQNFAIDEMVRFPMYPDNPEKGFVIGTIISFNPKNGYYLIFVKDSTRIQDYHIGVPQEHLRATCIL